MPPEEAEAEALYEGVYCARGECENRIKEQQLDLFAGRTSCHEFLPNQFRVLLSAAAYVLIDHLRRRGLAGTELEQAQAGTIRLKLLKVGARVVAQRAAGGAAARQRLPPARAVRRRGPQARRAPDTPARRRRVAVTPTG